MNSFIEADRLSKKSQKSKDGVSPTLENIHQWSELITPPPHLAYVNSKFKEPTSQGKNPNLEQTWEVKLRLY